MANAQVMKQLVEARKETLPDPVEVGEMSCSREDEEVSRVTTRGLDTITSGAAKRRRITSSPGRQTSPPYNTNISDWQTRALEAESQLSISCTETARLQAENADLKVEVERLKKHRDSMREMLMEK